MIDATQFKKDLVLWSIKKGRNSIAQMLTYVDPIIVFINKLEETLTDPKTCKKMSIYREGNNLILRDLFKYISRYPSFQPMSPIVKFRSTGLKGAIIQAKRPDELLPELQLVVLRDLELTKQGAVDGLLDIIDNDVRDIRPIVIDTWFNNKESSKYYPAFLPKEAGVQGFITPYLVFRYKLGDHIPKEYSSYHNDRFVLTMEDYELYCVNLDRWVEENKKQLEAVNKKTKAKSKKLNKKK